MSEPHPRSGSAKTHDSLVGRVVSERYRIMSRIGEGDRGAVYVAEHLQHHGRKVALKVLLADAAMPATVDRFLDEARTVARIGHENVIEIFYGGRSPEGFAFLAMEYLEAVDLAHVLRTQGSLPW